MSMVITWAHRNRIMQADNAIEWTAASIGPEAGVHYALQVFSGATLLAEKLDIDGETATVASDTAGPLTFRLWAIRDGLDSWQPVVWMLTQAVPDAVAGTSIAADTWTPPPTGPTQPHGEALVASNISPPVLLTNSGATDYVYSS